MSIFTTDYTIGLLGGGQLGKMLLQASLDLNLNIHCLDPDENAPCRHLTPHFVQGSLTDFDSVYQFGKHCELITIEIENANLEALEKLESEGKKVFPQPKVLRIIQDKRIQKQFFLDHNIPTAAFILTDSRQEIEQNLDFLPAFNKVGKGGYDGKGVQRLNDKADLPKAFTAPSLLEKLVDFEKEIAIIVARNEAGQMTMFPVVEMVFHPEHNLVDYLFSPANISPILEEKARKIAQKVTESLGIVGLLAVEMFVCADGEILVNEVAPRTHNSGHHTQKANFTSQFEQQFRAILGLPFGSPESFSPAAMVNVLGADGFEGDAIYMGMEECLALGDVYPFLYGKKITKPFRKMGHVTVLGKNQEEIAEKVKFIQEHLKVQAK